MRSRADGTSAVSVAPAWFSVAGCKDLRGRLQDALFCYVDDMVEGFLRLMENGPELIGSVNIGDPGEFTIRQLAEIIIEMAGSQSRFARFDLPRDDPTQRQPDITLAGEGLDWAPKVERAEGLGKTIAYFCVLLPELQTAG